MIFYLSITDLMTTWLNSFSSPRAPSPVPLIPPIPPLSLLDQTTVLSRKFLWLKETSACLPLLFFQRRDFFSFQADFTHSRDG